MATELALRDQVLEVLKQVAPEADLSGLDPLRSFRDQLGIDSIDFINFIIHLEEALNVRIDEDKLPQLSSLAGCVACLKDRISQQAPSPAATIKP